MISDEFEQDPKIDPEKNEEPTVKPQSKSSAIKREGYNETIDNTEHKSLDKFLDLPIEVRIELGATKLNLMEIIKLRKGGVIAVDKFAGEPLDILINGKVIAHGEAVVVNDAVAIRLTDIVPAVESYETKS